MAGGSAPDLHVDGHRILSVIEAECVDTPAPSCLLAFFITVSGNGKR
jgi:hypothetical protein